jgi:hypothetical protein
LVWAGSIWVVVDLQVLHRRCPPPPVASPYRGLGADEGSKRTIVCGVGGG